MLLQQLADRMRACLRPSDTLSRMDGDEFAVVLGTEQDRTQALQSARRIASTLLSLIAKPVLLDQHDIYLTGSIGIVTHPHDGSTPTELLKNANTAMYRAKSRAGNAYQLYDQSMSVRALERLNLEIELRSALVADKLELHYQPARNLATGRVDYVEALLRWEHPQLGNISPKQFITIAEDSGLMLPLGQWVLEKATEQAAKWREQGYPPLLMAVNLSLRQFGTDSLVSDIAGALARSGLPPDCLALEITESTIMEDSTYGQNLLEQISDMGITLLIDDFGTGYSSLARLRKLPIHTVKIDRSFISDIASQPHQHCQIVDAIIAMAHSMNMQVTAEGVETAEQERYLSEHGCDRIQGYWVSKAVPAADLENNRLIGDKRLPEPE